MKLYNRLLMWKQCEFNFLFILQKNNVHSLENIYFIYQNKNIHDT